MARTAPGCVDVRDPWGNRYRLLRGTDTQARMARIPTNRSNTEESVARGVLVIVEVAIPVAPGRAGLVADFYAAVFGFRTDVIAGEPGQTTPIAHALGGPVPGSQRLVFYC